MKHIVTTILLSLILTSCSDKQELPAGLRGGAFKLPDNKQEQIIKELKNNNIVFTVDDRGFINYMAYDISKVRQLKRSITYGSDINKYDSLSVAFTNPELKDAFVRILKTQNIWYDVSNFEGIINVHYFRNTADIVDVAYQEAYFDYHKNKIN
ncbi:MAG: hypothetical protein GY784_06185 [Gammaproteobacteria bacterium]|nr:hypothetical protein [Gammaproteobacteria bacterium]